MTHVPVAHDEEARLAALHAFEILDTDREAAFDDITQIASRICGAPISAINLIDAGRLWFKSEIGLGVNETPLERPIATAILQPDVVVVPDVREDPRFAGHPLLALDPKLRFYAGALLETEDGHAIGTVCVLDYVVRDLDDEQRRSLRSLAHQVMVELELRRSLARTNRLLADAALLNDQLHQTAGQLKAADAAKDELLGLISHELRTPLTLILGWADQLRSGRLTDESARSNAANEIFVAGRRLERVVSNMLMLAHPENEEVDVEPLLLQRLLPAAIRDAQATYPSLVVETRFETALPAVLGQSSYITQTVANLLSNAAKYGSPGKPVVVSAENTGTSVVVAVANPGEHVLTERLELLVQPFYRDAATRTTAPGLGLGLSVCRRLVEAQNGVFEIAAPQSGGLRATFTLPLAADV